MIFQLPGKPSRNITVPTHKDADSQSSGLYDCAVQKYTEVEHIDPISDIEVAHVFLSEDPSFLDILTVAGDVDVFRERLWAKRKQT